MLPSELLDRDVYGDVKSLEEAMRRQEAPFYLRRVKEALVTFPDTETGKCKALFTRRVVRTTEFRINLDELDFYDALTRFFEDQSIKAASEDSARGRALGFTMAMLQRRFASSIYAVRRSLQRMKEKRDHILADPMASARRRLTSVCQTISRNCPMRNSRKLSPNSKTLLRPTTRRPCVKKS